MNKRSVMQWIADGGRWTRGKQGGGLGDGHGSSHHCWSPKWPHHINATISARNEIVTAVHCATT